MTLPSANTVVWLGRLGFAARGVVYLLIGTLAVMGAFHLRGGRIADQRQALSALTALPFGAVILAVIGCGLACYALWRFVAPFTLPLDEGKRWRKLVAAVFAGGAYLSIAAAAIAAAIGYRSSTGGGSGERPRGSSSSRLDAGSFSSSAESSPGSRPFNCSAPGAATS